MSTGTVTVPPAQQRAAGRAAEPGTARRARPISQGEHAEALYLVSSACSVIALVCVWMLLQLFVLGGLSEHRAQHLLYSRYRTALATETAPSGALDYNSKPVVDGTPIATISIPAIGMSDAVVVEGTSSGDLVNGPGHLRTTPMPGEVGTSVVMGRAATYGGPFGSITSLRPGDEIDVLGAQGRVAYTVKDVRHAGDSIPPLPTGASAGRLILATADSGGFLSALHRHGVVYVDADTARAKPTGPVYPSVTPAEGVMASDTSALPALVLLLALLAGVVLAVSVARRQFRASLVWLVAAPVVIALAWTVADQVVRLLPNLM